MKSPGQVFADRLEEKEERDLAPYALKSRERRSKLGANFREKPTKPREYRTEYHRDRDRILWSKCFKRLQHKTQIFPHYVEDHYKRRLTHSLEVAQIATTIARALELNETATEAIALGHDLGHTPFGHAGERALNKILANNFEEIKMKAAHCPIPIFGFDHCVHGIEAVSRIEKEYSAETGHGGLNLTFDVRDGILKHMYERKRDEGRPFSNIPEVVKFAKYEIYGDNKSSLEAQCVHFADKVGYLFGDIEDGVRSNILECKELNDDAFVVELRRRYREYRDDDISLKRKEDFFVSFRSKALTTLILDCIDNAIENLKKSPFGNVDDVLLSNERVIFVCDDLKKSWDAFYEKWMRGNLFKNELVMACTFKAEKIVADLFKAYLEVEDQSLIKKTYRDHCRKAYQDVHNSDEDLFKLILIRNYISGMTDAFATNQHARLFAATERIRL